MTTQVGNQTPVFGVFKMRLWERDFSPIEIFDSQEDAINFMIKNSFHFVSSEEEELAIYVRSSTDWNKIPKKDILR